MAQGPLKTVLIADDDRDITRLIAAHVADAGFDPIEAFDTIQAMRVVMRNLPAAILLDVMMPGGTGIQMLQRLQTNVVTRRIPVIVISASQDPELPDKVKKLGAVEYLPKPLDLAALGPLLARVTSRHTVERPRL